MHKHHAGNRNRDHLREEDETAEKLCRTDLKMSVAWEFVVKKDGNLLHCQNNFKGHSSGVFKNQFCIMSRIN